MSIKCFKKGEENYVSLHAKLLSKFVRQKCTGSNPKMNKNITNEMYTYLRGPAHRFSTEYVLRK